MKRAEIRKTIEKLQFSILLKPHRTINICVKSCAEKFNSDAEAVK